VLRVLVLLAGVLGPASVFAQPALRPLSTVRSWGYQLGDIDPEEIAGSGFDLVVIDYSRDGSDEQAFTAADVAAL
jgi:uncharacterized protein (TIGR01370 family)